MKVMEILMGHLFFTGFRPAWVMIKTTQQDGDWIIIDNKRDPDNVTKANIEANQAQSENTSYEYHDFCANGFKLRTSSASRTQVVKLCFFTHLRNHHLKTVGQGKIKLWHLN